MSEYSELISVRDDGYSLSDQGLYHFVELEHIESIPNSEKRPIIIKFNPWNYSDQNQLIAQFFKELALVLSLKDNNKGFENAAKLLDLYSTTIVPLIVIPNPASPLALGQAAICKTSSKVLRFFHKQKQESLEQIKDKLDTLLQRQKRKLFIVIDDIDRLNNTETRQIFQLVKSLADFKNTIYLFAYDKDVVIDADHILYNVGKYDYVLCPISLMDQFKEDSIPFTLADYNIFPVLLQHSFPWKQPGR